MQQHGLPGGVGREHLVLLGLLVLAVAIRWVAHKAITRIVSRAAKGVLPDRVAVAADITLHLARRVSDA